MGELHCEQAICATRCSCKEGRGGDMLVFWVEGGLELREC